MYGPKQIYEGNYATVVAIFEKQFKENKKLTVVKPGTQSRDFTHVNDIVRGVVLSLGKNMNYEWHLRSGKNITIIELAELFGEWTFIDERKGERFSSEYIETATNLLLEWEPVENLNDWISQLKS